MRIVTTLTTIFILLGTGCNSDPKLRPVADTSDSRLTVTDSTNLVTHHEDRAAKTYGRVMVVKDSKTGQEFLLYTSSQGACMSPIQERSRP